MTSSHDGQAEQSWAPGSGRSTRVGQASQRPTGRQSHCGGRKQLRTHQEPFRR